MKTESVTLESSSRLHLVLAVLILSRRMAFRLGTGVIVRVVRQEDADRQLVSG